MENTYNVIKNCKNCELYNNQLPLIQQSFYADVFWVGLSAVKINYPTDIPLSPNTNSGKLINSIELNSQNIVFHKTNLVKCLPLKNSKIRYPSLNEMKICCSHLKDEISSLNPKLIFLLGKQVSSFVLKEFKVKDYSLDENFNYSQFVVNNNILIPIHHPSFILVYKRKKLHEYIYNINKIINKISNDNHSQKQDFIFQSEVFDNLNYDSQINNKVVNAY